MLGLNIEFKGSGNGRSYGIKSAATNSYLSGGGGYSQGGPGICVITYSFKEIIVE